VAQITLEHVSLEFHAHAERHTTLQSSIGRLVRRRRNEGRTVKALQDLSLTIRAGERVGLIGHNGAGKSTLLKVMAGIYPPQHGRVATTGHICPLFEFITGFEMEATGWENIRTRALLLGMSPAEIDDKIESIAAFSNLGEFLDIPLRHYSTGMCVRLAFATSTAVDPQILLLDEVMAAGDAAFIESARRRMNDLMERASIVVFASHSLDVLPQFCSRTLLLRKGRVVADGPTGDVIERYAQMQQEEPQGAGGQSLSERTP
jgi:ABC-type polysaccharide/polyol phosphate transport system ATPase subunit